MRLLLAASAAAAAAQAIPDEAHGYIDVRKGAHMYGWLYGAENVTNRTQAPLIMWLQGGPGASSTGYGNFEEFGVLDTNLQPRNTTWAKVANLLFVDQPVGTGFSYVDNLNLIPTDNDAIAADLVSYFTQWLEQWPVFKTTPFYIFCESYGGKMTSGFAAALLAALKAGNITANFRGISLGDSWIAPELIVDQWGPFLQANSIISEYQLQNALQPTVTQCDQQVANGQWAQATNTWGAIEGIIEAIGAGVDFYDVRKFNVPDDISVARMSDEALALAPAGIDRALLQKLYARHVGRLQAPSLSTFMNTWARSHLGDIPSTVTWGGQSDAVFSTLSADFMRPVVDVVDSILADGSINVTVLEGSVDLICLGPGADAWMKTMKWPGMANFYKAPRQPRYQDAASAAIGATGGFSQSYGPFRRYDVLQAGHMVPADQGAMALAFVRELLDMPPY